MVQIGERKREWRMDEDDGQCQSESISSLGWSNGGSQIKVSPRAVAARHGSYILRRRQWGLQVLLPARLSLIHHEGLPEFRDAA